MILFYGNKIVLQLYAMHFEEEHMQSIILMLLALSASPIWAIFTSEKSSEAEIVIESTFSYLCCIALWNVVQKMEVMLLATLYLQALAVSQYLKSKKRLILVLLLVVLGGMLSIVIAINSQISVRAAILAVVFWGIILVTETVIKTITN